MDNVIETQATVAKINALTKTEARYDMHQTLLTIRRCKDESRAVQAAVQAVEEEKENRKMEESENWNATEMKSKRLNIS